MRLEDAISTIDKITNYGELSIKDYAYWSDRILSMNDNDPEKIKMSGNLQRVIFSHNYFYNDFKLLVNWSNSKFPDPKDHGINAEKWFREKKLRPYKWSAIIGSMITGTALIFNNYLTEVSDWNTAGGLALILAGTASTAIMYSYEFNYYKLRGEKDTRAYLNDVLHYFSKDMYFGGLDKKSSEKNLNSFKTNLSNHIIGIEKFIRATEKYSQKNTDNLIDIDIELNNFTKNVDEIITTIRENKKYFKPLYDKEMAKLTKDATEGISLNFFHMGIGYISKLASKFSQK